MGEERTRNETIDREDLAKSQASHIRVAVLISSALAVALAVAFLSLHLTTPSDGARLEPGQSVWSRHGVIVTPLEPRSGGLRQGDVVVAIGGRSMESWAQALFQPGVARPRWRTGQTVTYGVIRDGHALDVPVTLQPYPLGGILRESWGPIAFELAYVAVALFVFLRRPRERAAQVMLLSASSVLAASTWAFGFQVSDLTGAAGFWLYTATAIGAYALFWITALHFALIFPRPYPFAAQQRWLIPLLYVLPALAYLLYLFATHSIASSTLAWIGTWMTGVGGIAFVYLALAVAVTTATYRASRDPATRQKIRWVVFGALIAGGGGLVLWILPADILGHPIISTNALGLLALPLPLTIAIAILRYQLFDIDVLINRTLVYGTLTGILAAIYYATVIGAQSLVQLVTGTPSQKPIILVASTLLIAALFNPLRRRLQAVIDRRFYRRKYDAARTLQAFGAALRTETDLTRLSEEVVAVVQRTMQPAHVSLWLLRPPRARDSQPQGARPPAPTP